MEKTVRQHWPLLVALILEAASCVALARVYERRPGFPPAREIEKELDRRAGGPGGAR